MDTIEVEESSVSSTFLSLDYQSLTSVNVGDYIQVIAAESFFPESSAVPVERDSLDTVDVSGSLVMNCWFAEPSYGFPPAHDVEPLFVSFHLNASIADEFLSDSVNLEYLRKKGPIGCRDEYTCSRLQRAGVEAYFSSCLTTTLGLTLSSVNKNQTDEALSHNGKILLVDPVSTLPARGKLAHFGEACRYGIFLFANPLLCYRAVKSKLANNPKIPQKLTLNLTRDVYAVIRSAYISSKLLSREDMKRVEYLSHVFEPRELPDRQARLNYARRLLDMYRSADLVISSRIHCCLPCLGFGTKALYLQQYNDPPDSYCRKQGLLDLLTVILMDVDQPISHDVACQGVCAFSNKDAFRAHSEKLYARVKSFLSR